MATHVGDQQAEVAANRNLLPDAQQIVWLEQCHSNRCIDADERDRQADACFTASRGVSCAVMTADCVPVLLCDKPGTQIAAVHAGWRGLASGIIANAVSKFSDPSALMAWIGPAICQHHFEVGADVAKVFTATSWAVKPGLAKGKYLVNLPALAQSQLNELGVMQVYLSNMCTYANEHLFYSHRRATHQGQSHTGRQLSAISLL